MISGNTRVGHVYPNRGDRPSDELDGPCSTLDAGRAASLERVDIRGWTNADCECGLGCRCQDSGLIRNINIWQEVAALTRFLIGAAVLALVYWLWFGCARLSPGTEEALR